MFGIKSRSALLALGAVACATTASAPSIYYKSQAQADAALAAFDKDNPDCQLWTNWQKMCSRMGGSGETLCAIDTQRRVAPSAAFCVEHNLYAKYDSALRVSPEPINQKNHVAFEERMRSKLRFCKNRSLRTMRHHDGDEYCKSHIDERPFGRPFWLFPETSSRLAMVEPNGLKTYGNDYGSYTGKIGHWCEWPEEYDASIPTEEEQIAQRDEERAQAREAGLGWREDKNWKPSKNPLSRKFSERQANGYFCNRTIEQNKVQKMELESKK